MSGEAAIAFEAIEVVVAPSFPLGKGFRVEDLVPGVNIVHGPNGVGKSTLACAAREALSPGGGTLPGSSVNAEMRFGDPSHPHGDAWEVRVHAGSASWFRDGRPAPAPDLPAARSVHLPLDALLRDVDRDFAEAVAKASQGGYDIDAAVAAIDTGTSQNPTRARTALDNAASEHRAATTKMGAVEDKERGLAALRSELASARAAGERIGQLEAALACLELRSDLEAACAALEAFPSRMKALRGDERTRLDEARRAGEQARKQLADAQQQGEAVRRQRDELGFPDEPPPGEARKALRAAGAACVECFRRVEDRAEVLAARQRQRDAAIVRVRAAEVDAAAPAHGIRDGAELRNSARELARHSARWRAESARLESARHESARRAAEAARLAETQALPSAFAASRGPLLAALLAIVAVGLLAGILAHPGWLALLAVAGVLAFWALRRGAWTVTRAQAAPAEPIDALAPLEAEVERLQAEVERRRAALGEAIGVPISTADEWVELLVRDLVAWFDAEAAVAEAGGAHEEALRAQAAALVAVNERLAAAGHVGGVEDAIAATAAVEDVCDRAARHDGLTESLRTLATVMTQSEANVQAAAERIAAIFDGAGLGADDDDAELDASLRRLPEYQDAVRRVTEAKVELRTARSRVDGAPELLERDDAELRTALAEAEEEAARADELSERIGATQRDVEAAKAGHDVEAALERVHEATESLLQQRDAVVDDALARVLGEAVRTEAQSAQRPEVFRRAASLLARITGGRLELELDERTGAFAARDTDSGHVRGLGELSVGERVQVLVAVRLGFAEHEAGGRRLPIFLDETLGTADDDRATAIIDAVIALAQDGHQVFYFTAQRDEVERWMARMPDGLACRQVDLEEVRGLQRRARAPMTTPAPRPTVPAPDGRTHAEYGAALGVPGLDPLLGPVTSVHLWHLVEDVELLHRLLDRGIAQWGQLDSLHRHGGATDALMGPDGFARLAEVAHVLERAFEAWGVGRGRPVSRIDLVSSECVSEAFLDPVSELLEGVDHDGARLVASLRSREVARWRQDKTDLLEAYLEEQGLIDPSEPLGKDGIWNAMLAAAENALDAGRIELELLKRLHAALPD